MTPRRFQPPWTIDDASLVSVAKGKIVLWHRVFQRFFYLDFACLSYVWCDTYMR
jgi:hypothetical protein